ncbi:MAG: hypothetical protein M3Y87_33135 [Myxococcota bacterium]|nr:hypothetical protein [Myxococcota bacterium]
MAPAAEVVLFGSSTLAFAGCTKRKGIAGVVKAATSGAIRALVLDARSAHDFFRAHELLRALYDDPRRARRLVHPGRVLALIATGDVEAAFTLGRYGIAGILEERAMGELETRLRRISGAGPDASPLVAPTLDIPAMAPPRSTRLAPRAEHELPTVTIGHRHAPETLAALARYQRVLREHASASTVFADVATLIEVMVDEGLTCQTNLAAKAGATHTGQFIGSFEFYRELRRTRYGRIPDHPHGAIAMDVFIAVDEVLHEVLHLLFLANELRAGIVPRSTLLAEELSLTWWQAVVHNRVFPEWLGDRHILEINDDFLLSEQNAETRGFWQIGSVFDRYAGYPWVPYVIARLPERRSYIGERADLEPVIASFASKSEAAFLVAGAAERLAIPVAFDAYPAIPEGLRVGA